MYIKITFGGISTNDFDHIRHFYESMGGVDTLQIDYSFLNRPPEQDALPYCQEHKIGVIVRGPLAMGKLTGKFTEETTFPEGEIRRGWTAPEHKTSFIKDLERAEKLRFLTNGRTMSQAAIACSAISAEPFDSFVGYAINRWYLTLTSLLHQVSFSTRNHKRLQMRTNRFLP